MDLGSLPGSKGGTVKDLKIAGIVLVAYTAVAAYGVYRALTWTP